MKISTKGRYGVTAMYELALHFGQGPLPLKMVAEKQNISEAYLEQLMGSLRRAGFVRSVRGSQGGYELTKDPGSITVGDVIRALEGPIAPVECVIDDDVDYCHRADSCITRGIWAKVRDSINKVVDSITLADLCNDEKNGNHQEG
ncbi:MAG: Rrf2 family transcriptional regulator [Bacillota bacterium]|nr:AsnC family transcriptional regulator [Bacillota bacterium]HWR56614.1 Rrf2 family transcriptional regulator [Negativicutes bacterium]